MNNMWDAISHQLHFGNRNLFSEEDTIVLIDNDTETVHTTGMGYAIGHYARWIKRGAVRTEATSSDPLLQVTAFRHNSQRRIVLVIINNASAEKRINVKVNAVRLEGNLTGEQSTAAAYWQPLTPFALTAPTSFMLTVPAHSVTTIVGQIGDAA